MLVENIELYRGDDKQFEIAILNTDGTPTDLTDCDIKLCFAQKFDADKQYANIALDGNLIKASFTPELTRDIRWTVGVWDLQIIKNNITTTVAKGTVIIIKDVTP